jgi:hypothetical protein
MPYKRARRRWKLKFGMPMAPNAKSAWILGGTLLITAASTLAGCASMPSVDSRTAENAGPSKDIDGSISDSRPIPDACHVLRDALLDPARISVSIFSLFGLPIVFVGTAN